MSVGDTLSQLYFYGVTEPLMVQDVETIVLNDNKPRKKITLSCYPYYEHSLQMIWIEGIGVNTSIGSEILYCIHDVGSELNCFFQYGEHVYTPVNQNSCFQTVSNSENELNLYRIFPNPVQDYLNIEDLNTPFEFAIKTMEGRTILLGQGEQRIEVQQLPAGMYVLEILSENKIGVMKFVKR